MASRPATVPQLDTNETNRVIPAAGKITDGYVLNDILPASSANYLWGWGGDWLEWLDERSEDGATPATDLTLRALDALTVSSAGGLLTLLGGDGGATSGNAGSVLLKAGSTVGTGTGGDFIIKAGEGNTDGSISLWTGGAEKINIGPTGLVTLIGGLSVGSSPPAANPDYLRVGNTYFYMYWDGTNSRISFDDDDYLFYDRANNKWVFRVATAPEWTFGTTELDCNSNNLTAVGTIACGDTTITGGLSVGSTPPVANADKIKCGDGDFFLYWDATDPWIAFDASGDDVYYDRSANEWIWRIGGTPEWVFGATELDCKGNNIVDAGTLAADNTTITGGLSVGATPPAVVADKITLGDVNFNLYWDATDPWISFDSGDDLTYDRSVNQLKFRIGGTTNYKFLGDANGLSALSTRVTSTDDSPADGTQAYQRTVWNSVVCSGWMVTDSDGTVLSYGGWNVASVDQLGAGSAEYVVTHDANLDANCAVFIQFQDGDFATPATGLIAFKSGISSGQLWFTAFDGADQSQYFELIDSTVYFMGVGRTTVTAPSL